MWSKIIVTRTDFILFPFHSSCLPLSLPACHPLPITSSFFFLHLRITLQNLFQRHPNLALFFFINFFPLLEKDTVITYSITILKTVILKTYIILEEQRLLWTSIDCEVTTNFQYHLACTRCA